MTTPTTAGISSKEGDPSRSSSPGPVRDRLLWHVTTPVAVRRVDLFPPLAGHGALKVQIDGRTIGKVPLPGITRPWTERSFTVDGVVVLVGLARTVVNEVATPLCTEVFVDGRSLLYDGRSPAEARAAAPASAALDAAEVLSTERSLIGVGILMTWGLLVGGLLQRRGGLSVDRPVRRWMLVFAFLLIGLMIVGAQIPLDSPARWPLIMIPGWILTALICWVIFAGFFSGYRAVYRHLEWGRRKRGAIFFGSCAGLVAVLILLVVGAIGFARMARSATAPALGERALPSANGLYQVTDFTFQVDGVSYTGCHSPDCSKPLDARYWTAAELATAKVCYRPDGIAEDANLVPAGYRCGDPNPFGQDGG